MVVMSFNVRYDNPADAPNDWNSRKPLILETIVDKSADIIGMQEVLKSQLDDLDSLLPWYDYFGVGRDDGREKGEYVPVFYKMNRFEALDWGTFWLSGSPQDTGSVGWDAAITRIATWVKFRDLHLQRDGHFYEFFFINTHFDHMGDTARLESAGLIMDFISQKTAGLDVILTGDFNCDPGSRPYARITGGSSMDGTLRDVCGPTLTGRVEDKPTFTAFGHAEDSKRIDFIFINDNWDVFSYETLEVVREGIYISDHWPIISRIKVKDF